MTPPETKTMRISVNQTLHCTSCSELEIPQPWENVKDWYIKYDHIYITFKDGSEFDQDLSSDTLDCIDWKRPSYVRILNESYDELDDYQN